MHCAAAVAARWQLRFSLLHADFAFDLLFRSSGNDFIQLLFGKDLDKAQHAAIERRLVLMGAIQSAVILESNFRPKLLPKAQLQAVLKEIHNALIHD